MTQSRWEQLLTELEQHIGRSDVQIWFLNAQAKLIEADVEWVIEVENHWYAEWIRDNYLAALARSASAVSNRPTPVRIVAADARPTPIEPEESVVDAEPQAARAVRVNQRQRFDNFVVGACNKFAHAAAQAVADRPGQSYNPLFIYGSTGLGKTHLVHAVANQVLTERRDARVVYATCEDFMNEMINSIRYKRMEEFRDKYRTAAVLIIDDIQFLTGKDATQEEFFHTFNALQAVGGQIILTSDVIPKDIAKLENRLRTRFEGGLIADMQAPDKETLTAILLQKAEGHQLNIPPDLIDAIATAVTGSIRELEGVLNKLSAMQSLYGVPITLKFAREQLPDVFEPTPTRVTVSNIIEAVSRFHSLRNADITGNRRTRNLTRPRLIAYYLARTHTGLSFPEIGKEFGGRDHSTIQHGFKKVLKERKTDADLAYKIQVIEQALGVPQS